MQRFQLSLLAAPIVLRLPLVLTVLKFSLLFGIVYSPAGTDLLAWLWCWFGIRPVRLLGAESDLAIRFHIQQLKAAQIPGLLPPGTAQLL